MKVLVTGANGFLGSWVTRRLVKDGHDVSVLVRPNSDLSELSGINCTHIHGDVTDLSGLEKSFTNIDTVFHLAGVIAYKKSQRTLMDKVNVDGTCNVIDACEKNKVRKLVYLSSVTAIGAGRNKKQVLNEKSEFNIHDLNLGYFETKHSAETLVMEACRHRELDAVILNPSTIYGAGDAKKGSRKTQIKVAQGKFPFYTAGGVNVVAVEDVVDGIMSAWTKGKTGERYILCGENLLIKDLFRIIAEEAGVAPPKIRMPTSLLHLIGATGDFLESRGYSSSISRENAWTSTLYHWFDCTKAKQELDFNPRPSREAIANSVHWMKENKII